MEIVRKEIVGGRCFNICRTHLQMFSVGTVVGEKTSDVEPVSSFLAVAHQHIGQEEDQ